MNFNIKIIAVLVILLALGGLGYKIRQQTVHKTPTPSPMATVTPLPSATIKPKPSPTPIVLKSGIHGTVLLGPMCPVQNGIPQCADKPYATSVAIFHSGAVTPFLTVSTNTQGYFEVLLPPGIYVIEPKGGTPYPHCASLAVIVPKNQYANAAPYCDTGIR